MPDRRRLEWWKDWPHVVLENGDVVVSTDPEAPWAWPPRPDWHADDDGRLSETCRRCGAGVDHPVDQPGVDPELCWGCQYAAWAELDAQEAPAPPMAEDDIRRLPRYRPFRRPPGG